MKREDSNVDMAEQRIDPKQQMRKRLEAVRAEMNDEDRRAYSERICEHALELCNRLAEERSSFGVMSFVSFRTEVDVNPLTERLWQAGYPVAVPKVNRENKRMDLHVIQSFDELEPGAWGIAEPRENTVKVESFTSIGAVIVPGLAFDKEGGRLGYGGGFYDRFFRGFEAEGLPFPVRIGVCFGRQLVDAVPMEPHDYPVDFVVTEEGVAGGLREKSS